MPQRGRQPASILCPSVTEIGPNAEVFGVLTGSATEGFRIGYLTEALPATLELLAAARRRNRPRFSASRHPAWSALQAF